MNSARIMGPQFHGALLGYNKAEVDDYVARTESELEIQDNRQNKWEKQVADLNEEIKRLNSRIDAERDEKQSLANKNERLSKVITELEEEIQTEKQAKTKLEKEVAELQEKLDTSDVNPKTIQDAIISAQRMGEIVISEANQKAEEILNQAEMLKQMQEEAGRKAIRDAEAEADRVREASERKCAQLQQDYDRILLDVTGFKAELMKMYRKHMEMLAALPEKEIPSIAYTVQEDEQN